MLTSLKVLLWTFLQISKQKLFAGELLDTQKNTYSVGDVVQNFDAFIVLLVILGESENRVILQPDFGLPRQNDVAQSVNTLLLIERIATSK